MMLPFNRIDFNENDPILNFVAAYGSIIENNNSYNTELRKNKKEKYNTFRSQLVNCFSNDYRWNHFDDIFEVLNMFFPNVKLINYFDKEQKDIGRFYIQYIMDIAKTFITFRDGLVSVRNWSDCSDPFLNNYNEFEKIDLWNNISRTVTVDLFIAAAYVNFGIDTGNMFDVPNLVYLADMPLKVILKKGVAETHMHANAGLSYQHIWEEQMSLAFDKEKSSALWYCTFFRYYSAYYVLKANVHNTFEEFVFGSQSRNFILDWFRQYINNHNEPVTFTRLFLSQCKKMMETANIANDLLFDTFYLQYMETGTAAEILWYKDILQYLKDHYYSFLCECLLKYIRIKNEYFKDKIQRTVVGGLDYFQKIYDFATDTKISKDTRRKYYSIFNEQCKTGNLAIFEMKIVPKLSKSSNIELVAVAEMKEKIIKQIKDIAGAYKEYISNQKKRHCDEDFRFPQFGIIYHFIKQKDSDNFSGINCAINNRSDMIECFDYNTMRKNCKRYLRALYSVFLDNPILTDYIVGIDAASLENSTEPWVFAPVFRAARSSQNTFLYSAQKGGAIQNIGFTYHVGEDFRHIISGLRHIDEVLEHFDYRSGDRLGHALALGIDIDYLVMQNSMVAIPIMEYLENLLWMWKFSKEMLNAINVPKNLEFKIMDIATQIYGNECEGIDVHILWKVYNAKFDELEDLCISNVISKDECSLNKNSAWSFDKLLCSHYCPCYYEIYNRSIFVPTNDYVQFYKDIQKSLIQKVENMGVYVETNPSSNTAIGDIPSILDHPIVRLNNRGLKQDSSVMSSVLTTINSDDPIVFSTFVENEISYIYYALLNAGCNREEALEWIDKIREHGINSSFIKHRKQLAEIENDIEQILKIK